MIDFHVEIKPSLDILYGSASHCKYTGKGKNNITIIAVNKKALGQLYQQTQYYEGVNYLPIDAKVSSDHSRCQRGEKKLPLASLNCLQTVRYNHL